MAKTMQKARLPEANANIKADVLIIGAGLIGGLMAWRLQTKGLSVAMLDSGAFVDRIESVKRFKESPTKEGNSPYESFDFAPIPPENSQFDYYVQKGADGKYYTGKAEKEGRTPLEQVPFGGLYLRQTGGTSWHFTGHSERMYPSDFKMKSTYGVGEDWPISYDDLVPYYEEAERQWGVAGDSQCVAPPTRAYPLPVVPLTYLDMVVDKALKKVDADDGIGPLPSCRASVPYPFQGRAQCCGNASCRFICPVGAKYDGSVHVQWATEAGAQLYTKHVVYHMDVADDGRINQVRYRDFTDPDNPVDGIASGNQVILAGHGIEAPRLLLMSKGKNAPNGVANSSDQVGRNLMTLIGVNSGAYVDTPVYPYRGPVNATGAFKAMRDGDFRKKYAAVGTIVINGGFNPTLGPLEEAETAITARKFGKSLRKAVHDRTNTQVYLDNSVEVLPNPENRVTLSDQKTAVMDLPRPEINFKIDQYTLDGMYESWARNQRVLRAMNGVDGHGKPIEEPTRAQFDALIDENGCAGGAAMIAGTTRMGTDKTKSVVDPVCRSHDHDNLYIVGTGNYVTGGAVSPSLTAAALGLRACDHLLENFNPRG